MMDYSPLKCAASQDASTVDDEIQSTRSMDALDDSCLTEHSSLAGNDLPFPLPETLSDLRGDARCLPNSWPTQLQCLYQSLGTWEVPDSAVQQSLELRAALPVQLKLPQERLGFGDLVERSEWARIVEVKTAEQNVWGGFDTAPFPLPRPLTLDLGIGSGCDLLSLRYDVHEDTSPMNTTLAAGESAWPHVTNYSILEHADLEDVVPFRTEIHSETETFDTTLAHGSSAWTVMPESVLNAVPRDMAEAYAAGGFCVRETAEPEVIGSPALPPDEWCCVICLDENPKNSVTLLCGHVYHNQCVRLWLQKSFRCPLCRRRCRFGASLVLPPMVFDLEPWPMLSHDAIALDTATTQQIAVIQARAERHVSDSLLQARRQRLNQRFGVAVRPEFLAEVVLSEEDEQWCIGRSVVDLRFQFARANADADFTKRAAIGAQSVSWPTAGKWPSLTETRCLAVRREALSRRLEPRWSQMQEHSSLMKELAKRRTDLEIGNRQLEEQLMLIGRLSDAPSMLKYSCTACRAARQEAASLTARCLIQGVYGRLQQDCRTLVSHSTSDEEITRRLRGMCELSKVEKCQASCSDDTWAMWKLWRTTYWGMR